MIMTPMHYKDNYKLQGLEKQFSYFSWTVTAVNALKSNTKEL